MATAPIAPTWTVTLRADTEAAPLGLGICPRTGTITLITDGLFAKFNAGVERGGEVELGDRIIEVDGQTGNPYELLSARLRDGKLTGDLRLKLRRPLLIQPVVVELQPGEQLGLDVDTASTNVIQSIESGIVAELNGVYPNTVAAGDKIVSVDGKAGGAVDKIRTWAKDHATSAGKLELQVARGVQVGLLSAPAEEAGAAPLLPSAAWSFAVLVRVRPGESLGAVLDIQTNAIAEIEAGGAVARLCAAHPHALAVGDRVLTVDGVPCPSAGSPAELEQWFQGRKPLRDIPRDLRIELVRPVELAAEVTVLPPYEYGFASPMDEKLGARLESKSTDAGSRSEEPGTPPTPPLLEVAAGEKLPSAAALTTPTTVAKFVDSQAVAPPQRRWYQIFSQSCCETTSYTDTSEQQVKVTTVAGAA